MKMMMPRPRILLSVIAFCVFALLPGVRARAHGGEKIRVAVATPEGGEESAIESAVSARIEERLLTSGFFDVVERSEASLAAALEEIQFTADFSSMTAQTTLTDGGEEQTRPEFGKIADVPYLVFVTLEKAEYRKTPRAQYRVVKVPDRETTEYTLGLRIMDVESMRLIYARTDDYRYDGEASAGTLARDAVARVVDALYPFQIIARAGDRLFFNRGLETGVEVGDRLELFQAASVPDSATGNILTVETPLAGVVVDRAQAWVCEAVLPDPELMVNVSGTTRAKILAPTAAQPVIPTPEVPKLDW